MIRRYLIIILLAFLHASGIQAKVDYRFRTMSPEGGFYYDGVKSIQQDKDGFIWVLMENELYRFDGYEYKRYYGKFAQTDKTKEWEFNDIDVDASGNLFVTTNNGLYLYKRPFDTFHLERKGNIQKVKVDNRNNTWIRSDNTWSILNLQDKNLETPLYDGKKLPYIGAVFCPYNDDLYVSSNYGRIYRYNYTTGGFSQCMTMPDSDGFILEAKAHKGKLWVLVNSYGLYRIDLATFTVEDHIDIYKKLDVKMIRTFHIDKTGMLWFGALNGIYVMNPEDREFRHFSHSRTDKFSIPNNSVWSIYEDFNKDIWIGTYAGQVCYVNLDEKNPFKSYAPQPGKLNHIPVSAFTSDDRFLWIATEGGGINRMEKSSGEFSYFSHQNAENSLSHNNVKSMVIDKNRNLWIGMYSGGVDKYNLDSGHFKHFRAKDKKTILSNNIRKLVLESDSGLWINYQLRKQVVSYLSFSDESITHFEFGEENNENYIFDMLREGENQLWMISSNRIFLFNVKKREVKEIAPPDSSFMNFRTFCLDDSGNLWIGTLSNGLLKYDPRSETFSVFNDMEKYGIFSVFNICYDNEGSLWLGTDNGLIRYNISGQTYSRYDKHDGVQGDVYYPLAAMKGKDGNLYFGGTNGFTIVDPKAITLNQNPPQVIISDFLVDHTSSALNRNSASKDSVPVVTLKYNQTNFGFRFSSDNYLIPEKTRFKYRLHGYDNRWIEVDASNRAAMYAKVPPGSYSFEVVAANNDGVWNDTPERINVIRKAAPWFSWPAYILYMILFLVVVALIVKYISDKKKLKIQLYLENVEKQKNKEIYEAQLRFFTNISHDFKTPLSLIIAALGKLRREGLKEYYYRILNGNAQRLLNLVNELMDFRTVESGKMKLELQALDPNKLVEEVASGFTDYAQQRNIDFKITGNPHLPVPVWIDKNILEKIIMNLLNNGFKSTRDNGQISVEIHSGDKPFISPYPSSYKVNNRELPISVIQLVFRDTGIGISKEMLPKVFERFYKINAQHFDSQLGTGIGLALVKSLVALHRGEITIYSEPDKGTDIVISLPVDQSIYPNDCFLPTSEIPAEEDSEEDDSASVNDLLEEDIMQGMQEDRRRILLVEDNEDLRNMIADYLASDFEVLEAGDGVEASGILASKMIDLVISDIMMPRKDGVTLSREIKENVETSHIPVVLLTAKTGLESKIEGVDSGADLYFEKPVDFELLKISIQNIFKQRQHLKEFYARNFFADSAELSSNERDNKFLSDFVSIIDDHIDQSGLDVNFIASELSMSRSKLYRKIKTMTDKSIVEFILNYRLRKAARIIIEEDLSMRQVMEKVGIESQPYFTNAFKKEFGQTPTAFAQKHKPHTSG
ncbi:hybrid sensor histidine kinase/response regulator [Maribellus luteus]|uniref:histidine kinase n=1 Tax=Maribellus luteus TaxID=2305463 RepID=A0A399SU27_9BACT|nr:hybrid sensor histidine kinase/response regulator transcription factor [Maribellus luteus]RIJ46379.1 hybrid sensor histidine kinase/response regulator [Maribellus luteus]